MKINEKKLAELQTTIPKNQIDLFTKFTREFYKNSNQKDFSEYSSQNLSDFSFSIFNLLESKQLNSFKVKCYNDISNITIFNIINDDKPFLLDSIIIEFEKRDIAIKNIIHPILSIERNENNQINDLGAFSKENNESIIQIHCEKIYDITEIASINTELIKILDICHLVVSDWSKMLKTTEETKLSLQNYKKHNPNIDIDEFIEFIDWIKNNNLIFLGLAEYKIYNNDGKYSIKRIADKTAGVLRTKYPDAIPSIYNRSSEEIEDSIKNPYYIEILKSKYTSKIHRSSYTERIRIQKFNDKGEVCGEYRFVGLFTSSAYYQSFSKIPLLRNKITNVIQRAGYPPASHNAKDLLYVLDSYPRDELFQISENDLYNIATGIVNLSCRSVIRVFPRIDKFKRFISFLIFLPKELFNTAARQNIQKILEKEYNGYVDSYSTYFTMHQIARLHIIVKTDNVSSNIDISNIEKQITEATKLWSDSLKDNIYSHFNIKEAGTLYKLYKKAFSLSYQNRFYDDNIIYDIQYLEKSRKNQQNICSIYKSNLVSHDIIELKIYSTKDVFSLSMIMPILESFYFNVISEHTYSVELTDEVFSIQYYKIVITKSDFELTDKIKHNIEEIINRILTKVAKPSNNNKLAICANLNYKEIFLIDAYSKYLYQANLRYNPKYISDILYQNSDIVKLLSKFFYNKFDPKLSLNRSKNIEKIEDKIKKKLSDISNINHDEVIRKFFNVIESTNRTNFFQNKDYLSFKIASEKIINLPLPKPFAEIFVFSNEVEAIHLRGGKVARGGLRWSDRLEDFRFEVLDLVKTQMTKNAQIIPVGSKGGFVIKSNLSDLNREQISQKAIECYKTFLKGMLDITDNVINNKISHPDKTVTYDHDDPYLVVAADKGTATFSDIANSVSKEYNFWLQDAFASGGSEGYDHKKMGITARGAWVSVVRHFMELGKNIDKEEFTVAAIGDMSGDVFGNGMLLSNNIRLQAAFNHLHIFIDPNPNSKTSFEERKRLFKLPRSSWSDYNQNLISKGGAIFSRAQKNIKLSKEIKNLLDITTDSVTPDELISFILKAKVDLLWNGGIGTYIKASDENNSEVSDRISESVRINASDLKCEIIGEGGNLGITQRGRIEFALMGKKINTDAIDNAAGVDCSDHEVNIKIALMSAIQNKKLSVANRSKLLESMTDEVAKLVLNNNRLQTQIITVEENLGHKQLDNQSRLLNTLSKNNLLNRKIEFLPNFKEIQKRKLENKGLLRPELAIILAYTKMDLYNKIIESSLVNDPYFENMLINYFPVQLRDKFSDEIKNHRLRKEIIATEIVNSVINRAGFTFINQLSDETGKTFAEIAKTFIIIRDIFDLQSIWTQIEELDHTIPYNIQAKLFQEINNLIYRMTSRFLKLNKKFAIDKNIKYFIEVRENLYKNIKNILPKESIEYHNEKVNNYKEMSVPNKLSDQIAALDSLSSICDIINITNNYDIDLLDVAKLYFKIGDKLHFKWLLEKTSHIAINSHWDTISVKSIIEEIFDYQLLITKKVIKVNLTLKEKDLSNIDNWLSQHIADFDKYEHFIAELKSNIAIDLSIAVVATNNIKNFIV